MRILLLFLVLPACGILKHKYQYGDRVTITTGVYRGCTAKVVDRGIFTEVVPKYVVWVTACPKGDVSFGKAETVSEWDLDGH